MSEPTYPTIVQTVIDTTDARRAAEFYRQLLGLQYRPGDEQPPAGEPDQNGQDWLVLRNPHGGRELAYGKAVEVMDLSRAGGARSIAILTEKVVK